MLGAQAMLMGIKRRRFFALLSQHRGLICLGIVLITFGQAGLFVGRKVSTMDLEAHADTEPSSYKSWASLASGSLPAGAITEHPIPKLMADAEANFRKLLSKQSRTLKAAVSEYKRRYKRDPPKGFGQWWQFAKDNDVKIVDEYDGLVEDLAPFWEISGGELRRRAEQVRQKNCYQGWLR